MPCIDPGAAACLAAITSERSAASSERSAASFGRSAATFAAPALWRRLTLLGAALAGLSLAGCSSKPSAPAAPAAPTPVPLPAPPLSGTPQLPPSAALPGPDLPAPRANRSWDDFRQQAARRLVAANPERSYITPAPDPLLAIPVLEVELNGDGSVRHVRVLRQPRQALDTVQLAIDAVRRAAPFGDVSRLPRPWVYTEVFLFDDSRRFKPRILD